MMKEKVFLPLKDKSIVSLGGGYEHITKHMMTREVLLLGNFNARTSFMQVPLHDLIEDEMQT